MPTAETCKSAQGGAEGSPREPLQGDPRTWLGQLVPSPTKCIQKSRVSTEKLLYAFLPC